MGALGIRAAAAKSCPVSPAGRHFTKRSMVVGSNALCAGPFVAFNFFFFFFLFGDTAEPDRVVVLVIP